jgi:hypothetical protein
MITLISSLLGFFGSAFPDLLKLFKDAQDRKHELAVLQLQLQQQAQGHQDRLEEIRATAESAESQALYKTYQVGIHWVDALNGTVRPVLAYAFFALYAITKCLQFSLLSAGDLPWLVEKAIALLWQDEDRAIFAGIISFYFGQRAMGKLRK